MTTFRTTQRFAVTTATPARRTLGYACSLEHAESIGERRRAGTPYLIWEHVIGGEWHCVRERVAG